MSISKIFLWCLLAFIAGIGLASFLFLPVFVYIPLFLLILILWVLIRPNKGIWLGVLCLIFIILGIIRYQASFPKIDQHHLSFYNFENSKLRCEASEQSERDTCPNNQSVFFQGQVIKEPDKKNDKTQLTVGRVKIGGQTLAGKILVTVPLYSDYQYGDILEVKCKLQEPGVFNQFNYHEYLARFDIYSICYFPKIKITSRDHGNFFYQKILLFKNRVKNLIDQNFTEPQGAIFSALLLGLKRQIHPETRVWFARAGTSHVLAVSGLHITILSKLIMIFLVSVCLIRRQRAFWLVALIIICFVILAGAPVSAVRAAIMGLGLLFAAKIGRPQAGMRIVILTAALMLLINPKLLKSDIGFQLSFASVLGLGFFSEYFNQLLQKIPNFRYLPLRYYLSATLSAQIFIFPLVLYYFGNLSLAAPLANVLILPILPGIMIFGFLFAIGGAVCLGLAKILFWPVWLGLTYLLLVTKAVSQIPYLSFVFGHFPIIISLFLYLLIIFWLIYVKKRKAKIS